MSALAGVPQIRSRPRADTRWQERAACIGLPSEVFFPENKRHVLLGARRVCDACPVKSECLEHALAQNEWHGIWGGLSVDQRRELVRRRKTEARKGVRA